MYTDCVIILISDTTPTRKSTSRFSKYKNTAIVEYSTESLSMDNIVKEFYTKYSKTSSRMIVIYDGYLYCDIWSSLINNSSSILGIYTGYSTIRLSSNIISVRPSYSILSRMVSIFCMYLNIDIFVHVGDTVGILDQMGDMQYYESKTMIKCKNPDSIRDIQSIVSNTDKTVALIINGHDMKKNNILDIIESVDADLYIILFSNYSITSVSKNVLLIYDPFNIESIIDICNSTRQYNIIEKYLNIRHYTLDVLLLNDGVLRDTIKNNYDTEHINTLQNSMYKYDTNRNYSICRKYRIIYYTDDDKLILWQECLNYYGDSLHYSSEDMIGCIPYSTISIDGQLYASTALSINSSISINDVDVGIRKYNLY